MSQERDKKIDNAFQEYLDWAAFYHNGGPSNIDQARHIHRFAWNQGNNVAPREKVEKLISALSAYNEYFEAIKRGEYEANRRAAPLRSFEQILQDAGRSAIAEFEKEGAG